MRTPRTKRSSKGQSISEYAAVLAFVSCVIAVAFQLAHGTLFGEISESYGAANNALTQQVQAAQNHN